MRFLIAICFLLVTGNAWAANVATSDVTNQAVVKKWHILFDVNHQPAARDDQFTFTDFTFFFDYQINKQHSVRVLQAPTKKYDVGLGENETVASDTILNHFWNTGYSIGPTRFRWVTALNLPTSIESQDNNKILTTGGTLQANTMLFANRFLVSVRPFFRYNWYEFKTSESGTPLPAFTYGVTMVNSYSFNEKLSLNATFSYSVVSEYASQYDTSTNLGGLVDENPSGRYSFDLSANYSWTDKFGTYLGYSQGDAYIRDGRYEIYAYDPQLSRYSFGMTFYF